MASHDFRCVNECKRRKLMQRYWTRFIAKHQQQGKLTDRPWSHYIGKLRKHHKHMHHRIVKKRQIHPTIKIHL